MGGAGVDPREVNAMRWAPPTEDRVAYIAAHLRKQDAYEVFCSDASSPKEAVYGSWKDSPDCRCIDADDGTPVGICGVGPGGAIWLLATDGLLATKGERRQFIRGGRQWVDGLIADGAGLLHNFALAKNRTTLRWLRSLGFTIYPPAPYGPCGELFCYFERRD
jgi:hypothetical protein